MAAEARFSLDVRPRRAQPRLHLLLREHGEDFLKGRWRAVIGALPEKQDILRIVPYDGARLMGLAADGASAALGLLDPARGF